MEDRKKALELFAKQLSEGLPFAEDFLKKPDTDIANNSLLARNLSEEALAHQVLKNTGIPVPDVNAPKAKVEDFYQRIMQERYPELTPKIITDDLSSEGSDGWFQPSTKTIAVDENLPKKKGMNKAVGVLLHEAGHQYDTTLKLPHPWGGNAFKTHVSKELDLGTLRKARDSGMDLKNMDPAQVYEIFSKGHHAEIPELREGSFGLGALKSYMKNGKFKQIAGAVPYVGAALTGAAALASPDASAAVGDAIVPGGLESLGPSDDDALIENPQANPELRKQALQRLMKK